jgi:hypothetical protein
MWGLPRARTELRCIALELKEGGGYGFEYPLRFDVPKSLPSLASRDDLRGGISFGGTGGGDDILTGFRLVFKLGRHNVSESTL